MLVFFSISHFIKQNSEASESDIAEFTVSWGWNLSETLIVFQRGFPARDATEFKNGDCNKKLVLSSGRVRAVNLITSFSFYPSAWWSWVPWYTVLLWAHFTPSLLHTFVNGELFLRNNTSSRLWTRPLSL